MRAQVEEIAFRYAQGSKIMKIAIQMAEITTHETVGSKGSLSKAGYDVIASLSLLKISQILANCDGLRDGSVLSLTRLSITAK